MYTIISPHFVYTIISPHFVYTIISPHFVYTIISPHFMYTIISPHFMYTIISPHFVLSYSYQHPFELFFVCFNLIYSKMKVLHTYIHIAVITRLFPAKCVEISLLFNISKGYSY